VKPIAVVLIGNGEGDAGGNWKLQSSRNAGWGRQEISVQPEKKVVARSFDKLFSSHCLAMDSARKG
jgi:hypothetical protein